MTKTMDREPDTPMAPRDDARPPAPAVVPGRVLALLRTNLTGRPARVLLLVVFLCMINGFDLAFTLLARQIGHFQEANPVARRLLEYPVALVVFKIACVAVASVTFILYRRYWLTEVACWCFAAVYVRLSVIWMLYFEHMSAHTPPPGG